MLKNYMRPLLGLAVVSISGTTATAQQKATEPTSVTGDKAPVYDVVSIKPNKSGERLGKRKASPRAGLLLPTLRC
jgi:hypothetical protein